MVTKEVVEQYEEVRKSGATNMFDYYNVVRIAGMMGLCPLAKISRDRYKELLMNFGKLMKEYGIK